MIPFEPTLSEDGKYCLAAARDDKGAGDGRPLCHAFFKRAWD